MCVHCSLNAFAHVCVCVWVTRTSTSPETKLTKNNRISKDAETLVPATNVLSLHFHTFCRWPDVGPFEFLRLQPLLCIGGCPLFSCVDFQYIHLFIAGGKFQTGEPSRFSSIRCTCFASILSNGFEWISLEATKFRTWQSGIDQNYFTSELRWEILHFVFVRSRPSTSGSLRYCLLLLF